MADLVIQWFKDALSKEDVAPFDKSQLNGHGANPQVWEAMEGLRLVRDGAGVGQKAKAANEAWQTFTRLTVPEIDKILSRPKRLYHCSELSQLAPMRYLIDGEIPQEGFTILFGASEIGKSFLALDYAERIAMRRPVVYVMGEGKSGYKARHDAWLKHHKAQHGKLYFIEGAIQVMNVAELTYFIDEIRDINPDFIVLDTLNRCFDGEENSARDMGQFIRGCDHIREQLKTAVMVVHHSGKSGNGERGSSALRAAADSMIEVAEDDNRLRVSCSKMKDNPHFDTYYLKKLEITLEPGITSCVLLPANLVKDKTNELSKNQYLVMLALYDNPLYDRGAKFTQLRTETGLADSSLTSALKSLMKRFYIRKTGTYEPYMLTEDGITLCRAKNIGK